jgi:hypothetical protein
MEPEGSLACSQESTIDPILNHINSGHTGRRDSVVGIATGYELDDRGVGVRVPVESRIFSSPRRPDLLWGPASLLSNGAWSWPFISN